MVVVALLCVFFLILTVIRDLHLNSQTVLTYSKKTDNATVKSNNDQNIVTQTPQAPTATKKVFTDRFSNKSTLDEAGSIEESKSPNWWLNSGAYLYIKTGSAQTVQGSLDASDPRRILYNKTTPGETDNGYHPQNIFRLVLRSQWKNFEQQAYYKITADNLSTDSHRTGSNGLLLFNRYLDGNNLYYTGIRVDGTAVIKKKINGTYYTMAQQPILSGKYDRSANPNLLPKNTWLGLKSIIKDNPDGTVDIGLYTDLNNTGDWTLALKVTDDGKSYGGQTITDPGYAGIRTDFMDVEFENYGISETK